MKDINIEVINFPSCLYHPLYHHRTNFPRTTSLYNNTQIVFTYLSCYLFQEAYIQTAKWQLVAFTYKGIKPGFVELFTKHTPKSCVFFVVFFLAHLQKKQTF